MTVNFSNSYLSLDARNTVAELLSPDFGAVKCVSRGFAKYILFLPASTGTCSVKVKKLAKQPRVTAFMKKELLDSSDKLTFLGTMGGQQATRINGRPTYCREYEKFGGSCKLREKLFQSIWKDEEIRTIGDNYSYTPWYLRDERKFGSMPTTCQGGGFFLILEKLGKEDRGISSLDYVTRMLAPQLENISGLKKEDLEKQFRAYGKNYLVHHFFKPVDMPKDGDLVIYPDGSSEPHYGLFKESRPNWRSPLGGTVVSKWSWSSDVFQHDVFFTPSSFGHLAEFYRIKNRKITVDTLAIKPHGNLPALRLSSNTIYTLRKDRSLAFKPAKENVERRATVDNHNGYMLALALPKIQYLSHIRFNGVCYDYAFGRVLSTYSSCSDIPLPEFNGEKILAKYFTVTRSPQKGDLVVYESITSITHWGIYLGDGLVESKWGQGFVYRHSLFDVPNQYGDTVKCYRLNDGLTSEKLYAGLKKDKEARWSYSR